MTAILKLLNTTAFRLSLIYVLAFLTATTLIAGALLWRTNDLLTRQILQTIVTEVKGLREQFEQGGPSRLTETIAERARVPGSSLYYLSDAHGTRLAGNMSGVPREFWTKAEGGLFHYARQSSAGLDDRFAVGVPILVDGGLLLVVGRDVNDQRDFIDATRQILMWGFALMTLAGLGAGIWMSRNLLNRIEAINAQSRKIMAGDLSQRLPEPGTGDELDRLAASLNVMLGRIEQLMNGLKEVSDNIAHDLKTPLTRLRNRAEAALADPRGGPAYRDGLERTIEEADELIKTFNALLSIARLEAGGVSETLEAVELGAVLADVTELYEPVAEEAGFTLQMEVAGPLTIRANRQLLGQALANLIDNAIKYGDGADWARAPGSAAAKGAPRRDIVVRLEQGEDQARIVVADHGPGIPADARERVLKRFVRLEVSRSRPGSGLGLSLVAAVARLHGGKLRLEDNQPGLRVVLELPLGSGLDAVAAAPGRGSVESRTGAEASADNSAERDASPARIVERADP